MQNVDPIYQEAKNLEDALFRQRQTIEGLDDNDPRRARLLPTAYASHACLYRQESLERTHGTPDWTAAKTRAIAGNKKARDLLEDNHRAGITPDAT